MSFYGARSVHNNVSGAGLCWRYACLGLATTCLLFSGCSNGRRLQADLYQRELRLQEDEIYRLEDYIEEYQAIIRGYRTEVVELKQQLELVEAETLGPEKSGPQLLPEPDPSILSVPETEELSAPPAIEFSPASPTNKSSELEAAPAFDGADQAPPFNPDVSESGANPIAPAAEPKLLFATPSNQQTSEIQPATALSRGKSDRDRPPMPYSHSQLTTSSVGQQPELMLENGPKDLSGDTTLLATIIPAGAMKSFEPFTGEVSLMLTSSLPSGSEKRIARWDYTPSEVAEALTSAQGRQLIELLVLLPKDAPTDRPLRMWVRLKDSDGRKQLRATDVELLGNPPRLAEALPTASHSNANVRDSVKGLNEGWADLMQLQDQLLHEAAESKALSEEPMLGWRRALRSRYRDTAIEPATFFEPIEDSQE